MNNTTPPPTPEQLRAAHNMLAKMEKWFVGADGLDKALGAAANALVAEAERVRAECAAEAKDHARLHAPTLTRINEAHTHMTTQAMAPSRDATIAKHRVYTQSADEQCYLCALITMVEAAEAARDEALATLETIATRQGRHSLDLGQNHGPETLTELRAALDEIHSLATATLIALVGD